MQSTRSRFRIVVIALCFAASFARAQLQPNDLIAICGDSITEQKQYSVFIETYLLACNKVPGVRTMQFGWGGETSWGFVGRMDNDMLRYKPTVVTTCYGMNDGGYAPLTDEKSQKYHDNMTKLVVDSKAAGVRLIVVGSPGCVDSFTFHKKPDDAVMYNKTLAGLRDIARDVATTQQASFANVFDPMIDAMALAKKKLGDDYPVAGNDGVHPAKNGHLIMAYAFLKALGCDGEIGAISVDLAAGRAEVGAGHKVTSVAAGPNGASAIEIESTRYPFCFAGDPASPDATSGIIEFFPFNDDLNRFTLRVSGATSGKLKITWGESSKTFTKEQLGKGINLAAEFIDNPFSKAFAEVESAVRAQQNFETPMIKRLINAMPAYEQLLPDSKPLLKQLADDAMKKQKELSNAAASSVKPVKHTIRIEPAD